MTADSAARPATSRESLVALAAFLLLCVGGGAAIGLAFAGQTDIYTDFRLPAWAPPAWLFGPAWTVLYTFMGVSVWLVWRAVGDYRRRALTAFGVQLVLNFSWTPAFFGAASPTLGLVVIAGVLLTVGWWTFEAWRVRRIAGALQLPYILWVGYATALNAAIASQTLSA